MTVVATKFSLRRGGYYWLDTIPHESVTTVLGFPAKHGLERWKREQNYLRWCSDPERYNTFEKVEAAARDALDKAADRGSTVHSLAEALDAGGEVDLDAVPEKFQGYAKALVKFERDMKPITHHTEATVFSTTHRYAGTLDRICEIGGRTVLLDRKTSKDVFKEHHLQVTAYRHADTMLTKDDPPERIPMPLVEATAILLLGEDGTYAFREVEAPIEVFHAILLAYRWFKGGK